jgi:CRP-like cAMP-binding protein
MKTYPGAIKKLAMRTVSLFRNNNDMLFSLGEMDETVYILVNGWVTLSLGSLFQEQHEDVDEVIRRSTGVNVALGGVARRMQSSTFDQEAAELGVRAGTKSQDVHKELRSVYEEGSDKVKKSVFAPRYSRVARENDLAFVQAPGFFGENVLWHDEPPPRAYSAKCLTKAEFATITKKDIEIVVDELPFTRSAYTAFKVHIRAEAAVNAHKPKLVSHSARNSDDVFQKVVPAEAKGSAGSQDMTTAASKMHVEELP